jgi:hypothetical protein
MRKGVKQMQRMNNTTTYHVVKHKTEQVIK